MRAKGEKQSANMGDMTALKQQKCMLLGRRFEGFPTQYELYTNEDGNSNL